MTVVVDLGSALDALVDSRVWPADRVPAQPTFPYIGIVIDPFPSGPAFAGDARTMAWSQLIQVDVWQLAEDEDPDLPGAVRAALNGLKLTAPRLRAHVDSQVRAPEEAPSNIIHDAITIRVQTVE